MPKGKGYPRSTKSTKPAVPAKSKGNSGSVPAKSGGSKRKGY